MKTFARLLAAIAALTLAASAYAAGAISQAMLTPSIKATALAQPNHVLCINEGAQDQIAVSVLEQRYESITRAAQEVLGGRITTLAFPSNQQFIDQLPKQQCDLIFGKSMNVLSDLVASQDYQPIVKDSAPYVAAFVSGHPLASVKQLKGTTLRLPPANTYVATLAVRALLDANLQIIDEDELLSIRDSGHDAASFASSLARYNELRAERVAIKHIGYITAVMQVAEVGGNVTGAVNQLLLKSWPKDKPALLMPAKLGWSVIAHPRVPAAQVQALQARLAALPAPAVKQMKLAGTFVPATVAEMRELADYLRPAREALSKHPRAYLASVAAR